MNNVSLIGRLTADPELRHTQSGVANVRFTIAVDRTFTKQGEERQADFITITAWQQRAEFICRYFTKVLIPTETAISAILLKYGQTT